MIAVIFLCRRQLGRGNDNYSSVTFFDEAIREEKELSLDTPGFISNAHCLLSHGITIKIIFNFLENFRIFIKKSKSLMQDVSEVCSNLRLSPGRSQF